MSERSHTPRAWIGHCLMGVAVLHTLAAGFLFADPLLDIAREGIFDSINRDPRKGQAVWFVMFGALLALLALAVTALERRDDRATLQAVGVGLLLLAALGIVLMPTSGCWLAIPPGIALLTRRRVEAAGVSPRGA
ncbi:MAG: DUF6463 family protein [Pseudomonadota bacterium]